MAAFGRELGIPLPFLGCRRIQSPALQAAGCASCACVLHILILRYALLILRFAGVRCAVFLFLCCRREGDRSGDDTGHFSVFYLKVGSNLTIFLCTVRQVLGLTDFLLRIGQADGLVLEGDE